MFKTKLYVHNEDTGEQEFVKDLQVTMDGMPYAPDEGKSLIVDGKKYRVTNHVWDYDNEVFRIETEYSWVF